MPNNFLDQRDRWLEISESNSDYAIMFIKSWIPFNVWYCNTYTQHRNNDRLCINEIKNDTNLFRAKIVALLNNINDPESILFRYYLEKLHEILDRFPIPDATLEKRISFKNIFYRDNPVTATTPLIIKRNHEYKVEYLYNSGVYNNVSAVIVKRGTPPISIYSYTHTKYDDAHFLANVNSNITQQYRKDIIIKCFKQIDPKLNENLIVRNKRSALMVGNAMFINDSQLISKALIQILYKLRCFLFHGEIKPNKDNMSVYEPCYQIMRILLKSLN